MSEITKYAHVSENINNTNDSYDPEGNMEFCRNLSRAVIDRAVMDYTMILAGLMGETKAHNLVECEQFFRSPLFALMTDEDPERLMKVCQESAKKLEFKYDIRKTEDGLWEAYDIATGEAISRAYGKTKKYKATSKAAEANGVTVSIFMIMRQYAGKPVVNYSAAAGTPGKYR